MRKLLIVFCRRNGLLAILTLLLCLIMVDSNAQEKPKQNLRRAGAYTYLPSGYNQVGNTRLYYRQGSSSIDMLGYYNNRYYSSTYSDGGYKLAMKVGTFSAVSVDCVNGTTSNGVTCRASIEQQGELARICYTVTNTNDEDVEVSLGTHADVMIGYNDHAPISQRIDTFGQTYGLTMKDGNGAQLCVLFGSGLAGVNAVSDFWFGYYSLNRSTSAMVGNYSSGSNYMQENGSYDSGMGWCWKNRVITAGSTVIFSYLIGVGEVNLEPNSTFEVTPEDPDGWNDLSRPHRLTLNGTYESPAGLDGIIDYAVEDSEEWIPLTESLHSGDEFTATLHAVFDITKPVHVIKFRTRDAVGNTTMLHPIEYVDVSFHPVTGIVDKTYTGDSIYQTNLICDLDADQIVYKNYHNNVNAGTASFNIEGLFPYTIGRKTYTFTINPAQLAGGITIGDGQYAYNGQEQRPLWNFTVATNDTLVLNRDYTLEYTNNLLPGNATMTVTGIGNFTGTITASFHIDKGQLNSNLYQVHLPATDITYDQTAHGANVETSDGVGTATITYVRQGTTEHLTQQPSEVGDYDVYLEIGEGTLYYGMSRQKVGSFTIYQFDESDWAALQNIQSQLIAQNWTHPWDLSGGIAHAASLQGLTIREGRVVGVNLSNAGLTGALPDHLSALTSLETLNLSGNQLTGNIGAYAAQFPNLRSLDVSHNCIEDVYPMISPNVTTLNISQQTIGRVVDIHLSELSAETIASKVPSILLYDHANQRFITDINLLCTTSDESWGMTISYQNGQLTIPYVSEQNTYYGESGDILNVAVINNNGTREGSTFRIKLSFDEGDGNFDGQVNVLDLQTDVNYLFDSYKTSPFNFTAANLWKDNVINVQDVILMVNLLMNAVTDINSQPIGSRRNAPVSDADNNAILYVSGNQLILETNEPVAAFDITLSGANSMYATRALELNGMTINMKAQPNGIHVIGYSLNGACIPVGISVIGKLEKTAYVRRAMLSDKEACAITVSYESNTTGIKTFDLSDSDNMDTYDLLGRKVNKMSHKGLYIKNGRKMVK